jgi:GR25 family glycosyltransferase involved in LPS biosynthesis
MSYINTLVDKVYVINLDKDVERLKTIDASLRKQGISYERISATLGSEVNNDKRLTTMCNMFCTDGIKGCAISHHRAWEDMKKNGYARILVFEDDALIPDDFDKKVREVMYNLPSEYEIVFLGCRFFCSNEGTVENIGHTLMGTTPQQVTEKIHKVNGSLGAHATIYSLPFVEKIINEPIETHIDIQIQRWIKKYNTKAYGITPELVNTSEPLASSNLSDKFPPLLNSALSRFQVTKNVPLSWALSENQFKLGLFNVNLYNILFFLLAAIFPLWIGCMLLLWVLIETGVSYDIWNGLRLGFFTGLGMGLQEFLKHQLKTLTLK